jgi:hypothetical protein
MSMRTFSAAAAGIATVLFLAGAPALAQPAGAQEACTNDAMTLCQDLISEGNHGKIRSCLARKRASLSPECRRFFGGGGGRHHRQRRQRRS